MDFLRLYGYICKGPGDFAVVPDGCINSAFYCAVFQGGALVHTWGEPPKGVRDVTVRDVPLKVSAHDISLLLSC